MVNQEIKRYRVLNLPSSGLISGTNYELYLGGGQYRNYVVNDSNQLVAQDGKEFIECDTVDDLRNLDARQIWAIQNGYYKGVTLNGYYNEGDIPAPIQYYLSDTTESDDGGSVFEVGGIKLKHEFVGEVDVRYFGVSNDLADNYVLLQSIFNNLDKYKEVVFSNIQAKYSGELVIDNKSHFKLRFLKSSLYDNAKSVNTESSTTVKVPYGIKIINSTNFTLDDLTLDSACDSWASVAVEDKSEVNPHLLIENCENYTLNNPEFRGLVGGYITLSNASSVQEMMNSSYFFQLNSRLGVVNSLKISKGAGGGEFISLNGCENIIFNNTSHYQNGSSITFWSLGKIIDNKNIFFNGVKVQSNSTGSLFDVAGDGVTFRDMVLDYPDGKLIDITFEWGSLGIDTKNILVKDSTTNGVVCISAGLANTSKLYGITFDNVISTKEGTPQIYNIRGLSSVNIKNTTFKNNQNITSYEPLESAVNFYRELNFENCNIDFETPTPSDLSVIEICGVTTWNGGVIGSDSNLLGIRILDRYAERNSISDLRLSKSKLIFNNVQFKNISLAIPANVEFNNCNFHNCRFYNTSGSYNNMTIKWVNCNINYRNVNQLTTNADMWFQFRPDSPTHLIFENTLVDGELNNPTGTAIFNTIKSSGSTLVFKNVDWMLKRAPSGSFSLISVDESTSISLSIYDGSFVSTNILTLSGGATPLAGQVNVNILGGKFENNFISIASSNTPTTNNKVNINVLGVSTNSTLLNNLSAKQTEFNSSRFDWINATPTIKGLVNQSAASADAATAPSATYDQAEVQAILTELRDLKTKLRAAGILAT